MLAAAALACLWPTMAEATPAATIEASRVTLKGKMDLRSALAALSKSGNQVVDLRPFFGERPTNPILDLDLQNAEFWRAVDAVAADARLRVVAQANRDGRPVVALRALEESTPPPPKLVQYSGPFRLVLKQTSAVRNLVQPRLSHLLVTLEVACEPRYNPFFFRVGRGSVALLNSAGEWVDADQGGVGQVRLLGEQPVEWVIRLPLPDRADTALAGIRLALTADVPPCLLSWTFSAPVGNQEAVREGVTARPVRFEVMPDPRLWRVRLALQYPHGGKSGGLNLESHQTWALADVRMTLRDRTGREWQPSSGPLFSIAEEGTVLVDATFADDFADSPRKTADWQLHVEAPAAPVRVPIHVEFKNVPLP